ncbi:MAG: response regulator [Candidatus Binatia bacterium]
MGKRILLVEDDADNRRIFETVLRREGYDVTSVVDGVEAIERLATLRPDLVVVDLGLPRLDGWQTVRRMRSTEGLQSVPVIAVTALALQGDEERARSAGCDDYLAKPCPPARLREKVKEWISRGSDL